MLFAPSVGLRRASELWLYARDGDKHCLAMYRRHYSARKYLTERQPLFAGPGCKLVLLSSDSKALFIWRKFIDGCQPPQTGINCAVFRNEGPLLSSLLIRQAVEVVWRDWGHDRLYTLVNSERIRSCNPGCCFKKAGWSRVGTSKTGKIILSLNPMNLITQTLTLPDRYDLSPDAKAQRGDMLITSQAVTQVTTPEEQAAAAEIGSSLQAHIKAVKAARLELAKPLNDACDKLIAIEKDYLAPLLVEKDRVGRLMTVYQVAEAERVRREEAARQLELQRLENERIAAEAKAERARTLNGQLKAELSAHNATQAQMDVLRAPLPAATKARGAATRKKLCYRVTDMKALYAARPELCVVTERPSAIQAVCKATDKVPGLELWEESTTAFRS